MAIKLQNENLRVKIETPGEKYKGSRFDWNGTVTSLRYQGIEVLGQEKKIFHRNHKYFGRGLHNEFGMRDCIGYEECEVGEWFPKIGTGWLKKDSNPYFFCTQYEIDPIRFKNEEISDTKAQFTCISGIRNGYGYEYTKEISLNKDSLEILYKIDNVGTKTIATTEYVHNFLNPAHRKLDLGMSLSFSWALDPYTFSDKVNSEDIFNFDDNTIYVEHKPQKEFFLGGILNNKEYDAWWKLYDAQSGMAVSENVSFTPDNCDIWGHSHCISPELFLRFSIEPGDSYSWTRTYTFEELEILHD